MNAHDGIGDGDAGHRIMCRGTPRPPTRTLGDGVDGTGGGGGGGWEASGGGGGSRLVRAACMAAILRLITSMLAPIRSTTPARASKVSGAPEDSESSECTVEAGSVVAAETPEVAKGVVIVSEISDTRLLCALALPGIDLRLYE
jgi:hypothetical protein